METPASPKQNGAAADDALSAQVRAAVGRLYRRFRSERPDGALGDAALDVLMWLYKNGPQSLTALSGHAQVSPASMSQTVNRLTDTGHAVRTRDPADGRKVLFTTTPQGEELARTTKARRDAWLQARLEALGPEDRDVVARACALLIGIAEA